MGVMCARTWEVVHVRREEVRAGASGAPGRKTRGDALAGLQLLDCALKPGGVGSMNEHAGIGRAEFIRNTRATAWHRIPAAPVNAVLSADAKELSTAGTPSQVRRRAKTMFRRSLRCQAPMRNRRTICITRAHTMIRSNGLGINGIPRCNAAPDGHF